MWYRDRLLTLVVEPLREVGDRIIKDIAPQWPHIGDAKRSAPGREAEKAAAEFGDIDLTARRLTDPSDRLSLIRRGLAAEDAALAKSVHASIGVDIRPFLDLDHVREAMRAAADANIALITSIPVDYLAEVRDLVDSGFESGMRWETLVAKIKRVGVITENRAKLIARDQTGKINAAFSEIRQRQVGIETYSWSGTLDARERPSHRAMEGSIQRWDAPPEVDGEHVHPGQAVRCRCASIPVVHLQAEASAAAEERQAA